MARDMKEYLKAAAKRELEASREILRKAEDEARSASDAELEIVEGHVKAAEEYNKQYSELERDDALQKRIADLGVNVTENPSSTPSGGGEAKTVGERFAKSDAYQTLKERGLQGRWSTGPIEVGGAKSPVLLGSTDFSGPGDTNIHPQILPGIQGPVEQRLYVADLFGQGTATQNTVVFLKEASATKGVVDDSTGAAVPTSEGADKPLADLTFEKDSASLEKLAVFLPVSDEMIEDEPQIVSYINGRLGIFVAQAEEAKLVAELLAAGIGAADEADVSGSNAFDAIAGGILAVQVDGGLEPDALLINPIDFWSMSVTKAVAGDGAYFSGGPYAGPARNPWGLRTVVTTAVAAGTPVVGAFSQGATVWRKGGITVEASNSHSDYFRKNLTAIRAEERLALAVYRPEAFAEVTLPVASS